MQTIGVNSSFKRLAQMGYAARGVVYLVIGGLALMAAFGEGGGSTDSRGALLTILKQPFGEFLLGVLILGLIGYVIWRAVQAIKDTDDHGTSAKGIAVRGGLLISSILHASLAIWALYILFGAETPSSSPNASTGSGGSSEQAQGLLSHDWGQAVLAIIGIAIIGAGVAHVYKGYTARFERYMAIPADKESWAQPVCRFGLIARGFVWFIIGWFCIRSAMTARAGEVKGLAEAMNSLRSTDFGPWLYAIAAAGLFAFGVYSVLEALYRRINTQSMYS